MAIVAETNASAMLGYVPQGQTLRDFHDSNTFMRALIGPLGSGKTQACACEMIRRGHEQKPDKHGVRRSRWAVTRNTYVDLQSTTIKDFREIADPLGIGRYVGGANPQYFIEYNRSDGTKVKAEIMFLAFDRADDVRKIRGLQLTGAWLNELKELHKAVVDMLLARIGRFPAKADVVGYWHGAIADTNAPASDHWLGVMALETKPSEWWFGIQPGAVAKRDGTWKVNTKAENIHNLPENYYARQIAAHTDDWIRANLGNEFILVIDGRPVHPDFSQTMHVAGSPLEPTPGRELTLGFDFGRTPACAILQEQHDGRWYILDEVTSINMGARRFGAIVARFLNERYGNFGYQAYGDPAGSDMAQTDDETPFMMLEASGIYAWPAPSNDAEIRIEAMDRPLQALIEGKPGIFVSPTCKMLIRGLAGAFQFKRVKTSDGDRYHDRPVKSPESHVVEAAQYALYGAGEGDLLASAGWSDEMSEVEDAQDFDGWHAADALAGPR